MFKHIVVAVDGSEGADRALQTACEIAKENQARLTLVHAPQAETSAIAVGAVAGYHELTTAPTREELEESGNKVLRDAAEAAKSAQCDVDTDMRIGDPATVVLAVADEKLADLIICGRRGLGKLAGLMLGSTSQKIQHRASCACLTIP